MSPAKECHYKENFDREHRLRKPVSATKPDNTARRNAARKKRYGEQNIIRACRAAKWSTDLS